MTNSELRTAVRGPVLLPGEEGFEQAARPWSLTVAQPVAAVVEALDADDVAALVRYARGAGLTVSAQPSGHGASGDVEGVILLRTGRLDEVEVHPGERIVRAGAGVKWERVQAEASRHGLTGLTGSAPGVSVTGYTLGGGLGWFARRYGFAADSVRAFDVVDADGGRARVTAGSDPDLFWALCGGGGDFALVTAVEFDLYPAPAVYGGRIVWPGDRAADVLAAFGDVTASAPPELSVWTSLVRLPDAPPMVAVDAVHLGEAEEGRELLAAFDKIDGVLRDSRDALAVADLGQVTAEPVDPVPVLARTELLTGLDDEVSGALLAAPIDPLVGVQLRHLGGALARAGAGAGPSGPVAEPYLLYLFGLSLGPEVAAGVKARQEELVRSLGERVSGRKPYTFLSRADSAAAAFTAPVLARLREVKRARDPHNVFRANYSVAG
ncbi:FAD-binding oxidoreductase [Spongiactinospora sp. TRM90649]|uniref:FAD-binding oxidoreductase n=1 Tax=Spongiactinospora sp. TRM90649 TaxID=3031114 RepID=UPI0023F8422E|nr:FAD-binding oxidoreductase [Spongiactinospora sp. TRM90649]MDF5758054.1 FAD-binding oxidoreductase [Spongiactinospora sp. TRM90649]